PLLLTLFEKVQGRWQLDIAWTLLEIGAEPWDVGRLVMPLLADNDDNIRFQAGRLCALAVPEEARRQGSKLDPQLASADAAVKKSALYAIWGLAPEARDAVPALALLLDDRDTDLACTAAFALRDVGPGAAAAVPTLRALLARRPAKVHFRGTIFKTLERI